ncbi:SusC/RagA family TonB-linked outer membrane protein [Chryseolinea soli]|uniref:SusC/RagA family TonB-linked outer membrane protein n=1 Tax=Chryseolinea soli TaxID=2321403 RepID=A0A385SJN5_9BACT|nr:SusC/RagA family TonB-linked outer membrane protein [Chryseolinea soli]AYB31963.1 SusC/RagA family TonB-linked outer membrane protein [Chryseolinea soli]
MYKKAKENFANPKIFRVAKLTVFISLVFLMKISAHSNAQTVTLKLKNATVQEVLKQLSRKTGISIVYDEAYFEKASRIDIDVKDVPLENVLDICLKQSGYSYSVQGSTVVIEKGKSFPKGHFTNNVITVSGVVSEPTGPVLPGVSVIIKGTKSGTVTDSNGAYTIQAQETDILVFSFIGFAKYEVAIEGQSYIDVVLTENSTELGEIIVTGLVNRNAESFTGSVKTVTKQQLLAAGNQNLFLSLKNLDPSFQIQENLAMGSNPNNLPVVNLRGKSSMPDLTGSFSGNPNQPLFILDGFETTLQRVYDLDINRIKSVTILKDASAKAIYGAKAGNGVVVIETVEPESGQMRVNYTGSLNLEAPDLSGYNLMNAKEKLQWERDHDMWTSPLPEINSFREDAYNKLYQDVYTKGVDTYWLAKPVQTGVDQKHSVLFDGGDEAFRYGASFSYNGITGAMKGSDRKTYTGSTTLSYRLKKLRFRNMLEFSQNNAHNSPYGSFANYVGLNPYWTPYDENGKLKPIAGFYPNGATSDGWAITYNPLYNASLNIIDESRYTQVINNLYTEWDIVDHLRFTGSLGYTSQRNGSDKFLPPSHTDFIGYTEANGLLDYKGLWAKTDGTMRMVQSNLGLSYNAVFGKHFLFANATLNIADQLTKVNTYVAEGFGSDNANDISMGTHYQRASSPTGTDDHARTLGVVGIGNYMYDNRFMVDVSYRTSASSIYGANSRWGSFWSVGAGWNLHNERIVQNLGIFSNFRIRGSFGYTGSQNANSYMTLATYRYGTVVYDGTKGATLIALPNPDLRWQKNMDYNAGVDLTMFGDKLAITADIYRKITTNLLVDLSAPPSFGFETYKTNLGKTQNAGYEVSLRYQVFHNSARRAYVNISGTATHIKNTLKEISNAFGSYNKKQNENVTGENKLYTGPVARYIEGQSLSALWAVRSLGIDPASGNEVFVDRNGNLTDQWSAQDLVIAGNADPTLRGTIGFDVGYKGFSISLICLYNVGGKIYNATLVERVENIDGRSNLDRRIYDAWSEPGDISRYKRPEVSSSIQVINFTKPTTRFIQDNNELFFSTINVGYEVQSRKFLETFRMERLKIAFYTNELGRISSVKTERGAQYPFARNFSFSVQATF